MIRSRFMAAFGLGAVLSVAACSNDEGPKAEQFTTTMSGANERPTPVTSTATGTATFTINANRTISYDLTATGLTPTAQHIHGPASTSTAAGVIVPLVIGTNQLLTESSFTGAVKFDSLLVLMRSGQTYVNVHTAANPGGEIRGQLAPK